MNDVKRIHDVLASVAGEALRPPVSRETMGEHLSRMIHVTPEAAGQLMLAVKIGVETFHGEDVEPDDPYAPTELELAVFISAIIGYRLAFDDLIGKP